MRHGMEEQALEAVAALISPPPPPPPRFIFERMSIMEKRLLMQRIKDSDGPGFHSFAGGEELAGREGGRVGTPHRAC